MPTKGKFVSDFLTVMQRFPESEEGRIIRKDVQCVQEFFSRVAQYAEGNQDAVLKPGYYLAAFLLVNFPERDLTCKCNPFNQSFMHRSLDFVGAVFQVIIDCHASEDDERKDFLPRTTAENFRLKHSLFSEVLDCYLDFAKAKSCPCYVKLAAC
jgi:hypothetical protein